MHIYIMRHGQAQMMASSDAQRALTSIGIEQSARMAQYMRSKNVVFDALMLSPYLRAQQTWRSVCDYFPKVAHQQTVKMLTPSGSVHKTLTEIFSLQAQGIKSVLLISHLPLVGYLVSELAPQSAVCAFSTSSIAHIELNEQGSGQLVSMTAVSHLS